MKDFSELHLGAEGLQYVFFHLRGGFTFSKFLLERLDLESGEVVTYLPRGVSLADAKDFDHGGKLPVPPEALWRKAEGAVLIPTPTTRPQLVDLIDDYLFNPSRVCILENASASRKDGWLRRAPVDVSFLGDEVYHLLVGPNPKSVIDATIKAGQSLYTFVGALTSLQGETLKPRSAGHRELRVETLQLLAERTVCIFVAAYDGEGYLIWRRRDSRAGGIGA